MVVADQGEGERGGRRIGNRGEGLKGEGGVTRAVGGLGSGRLTGEREAER